MSFTGVSYDMGFDCFCLLDDKHSLYDKEIRIRGETMKAEKPNPDMTKHNIFIRKYRMHVFHSTCRGCLRRNCLTVAFQYGTDKQINLCPKCLGRGLVILQHPVYAGSFWERSWEGMKP
jgi:hypothetical protein